MADINHLSILWEEFRQATVWPMFSSIQIPGWTCAQCQAINEILFNRCYQCGAFKPGESEETSPGSRRIPVSNYYGVAAPKKQDSGCGAAIAGVIVFILLILLLMFVVTSWH